MTEGHQRRLVSLLQPIEHRVPRGAEMPNLIVGEAAAHIERHDDVQGNLVETCQIDGLNDTVVEHIKVAWLQPGHQPAVFGDERVDSNRFDSARERWRLGEHTRSDPRHENRQEERAHRHRSAIRASARICSISRSASSR
jgi:hypothetical protein